MKKKDPTSHRIIEKRRRDRMNNCLADLSKLIPSHYMKKGRGRVEKTEIIEMAIKHLKDLIEMTNDHQLQQRQQQNHHHHNLNQTTSTIASTTVTSHLSNANSANAVVLSKHNAAGIPPEPRATMATNEDLQQFSSHHETNSYLNHHLNANKSHDHMSSPTSSANGSDSSSSSISISSRSSSSSSSISSMSSIGSSLSNGIIAANGYCTCRANIPNGGSAASLSNSNYGNNSTHSTNAWYKKALLVRSFSRSPQR